MKTQGLLLGFGLMLLTMPWAGPGQAAELEGLQLKPVNHKVQVILHTSDEQPYQLIRANSGYDLILPKATLPEAFQGTGLPPIKSPETGVVANIQETAEGLCIRLRDTKHQRRLYQVLFKPPYQAPVAQVPVPSPGTPAAKTMPPLPLVRPGVPIADKPVVKVPKIKAKPRPKIAAVATKKPVFKRPVPQKAAPPIATRPKPRQLAQAGVAPRVRVLVPEKPPTARPPARAAKAKPQAPSPQKVAAPSRVAQADAGRTDGYSLLGQEIEKPAPVEKPRLQQRPPAAVEKPALEEQPGRLVFPQPGPIRDEAAPSAKTPRQEERTALPAIYRWVFVSVALLGGFILLTIVLAVMLRRWMKAKAPQAVPPEATAKEYFEEPPQLQPEPPETYEEAMAGVARRQEIAAAEKILTRPRARRTAAETRAANLLLPPATSVSEAVKTSLGSKPNPYASAPFKVRPRPPRTSK